MNIKLSRNCEEFLESKKRYKIMHGGRGAAKSYDAADCLLIKSLQSKTFMLCSREYQASLDASVHRLFCERVYDHKLEKHFTLQRDKIIGVNGSMFIFKGMQDMRSLKSIPGITHLWLEEADNLSIDSWQTIVPTIREEESEIWATFNPMHETDVLYKQFVLNHDEDALVKKRN